MEANEPRVVSSVLGPFIKLRGRRRLKGTEAAQILQRGEGHRLHVQGLVLPVYAENTGERDVMKCHDDVTCKQDCDPDEIPTIRR